MVRLSKIYTRTGDKGTTALVGGQRVPKTDLRVETFGTVDELNAIIGIIRTLADESKESFFSDLSNTVLRNIQNVLFDIGSMVATAKEDRATFIKALDKEWSRYLEKQMDRMQRDMKPLESFVLPGGTMMNAQSHVARTVCRRAERMLWRLHAEDPIPDEVLMFVNRLSDYLFVLSRWVSIRQKTPEYLWEPGLKPPVKP